MALELITRAQALATEQLADIASASAGTLEIVETTTPASEGDALSVRVSIRTSGYKRHSDGLKFRNREPINVVIPALYPLEPPRAYFAHKNFIGSPHVQWGKFICLFQSTDIEWSASDGMFAFIKRLDQWLRDAALNQLDPDDAPLHPPTAYVTSDTKITVDIDCPEIKGSSSFWCGAAKLKKRNNVCFDLTEWSELPDTLPEEEKFSATLLLNRPMPMEYPSRVSNLISTFKERGIPFSLLFSILKLFSLYQKDDEPMYFLVGAPMRRRAGGEPLRQHLAAWRIASEHVAALRAIVGEKSSEDSESAWNDIFEWALNAETEWCNVFDNRPEVTFRRDRNTGASWFLGKRIVLLGCGAIGSHIGEYLVRAGASKITLVDYASVKPGVLIRQQFRNRQVGYSKQSALAVELAAINPKVDIGHISRNLIRGLPPDLPLEEVDLIIDATASKRVAVALQSELQSLPATPPILRCAISSEATHGIAVLKPPESALGLDDLIRQTKLASFLRQELREYTEIFWPSEQHSPGFQPEPGCSEPTFIGSAADVAFFASSFVNFAAYSIAQDAKLSSRALFVRRADEAGFQEHMSGRVVDLGGHCANMDAIHGYRVLVSPAAKKAIQSEISLNARTGDYRNETGGLLLGEIDDAITSISIDAATGAPPDSVKTPQRFLCGVEGTEQICRHFDQHSGGSTRFVGVWHTHPVSMPDPSDVDLRAMAEILHFQEKTPRHVVMLIIGYAATNPVWRFHLFRKSQFQIVMAEDDPE